MNLIRIVRAHYLVFRYVGMPKWYALFRAIGETKAHYR